MGQYNLSYYEVGMRYAIMMIIVIIGGIMQSLPIMLLAMPFFLTGILGWCPLYQMIGIDHSNKVGDLDEH